MTTELSGWRSLIFGDIVDSPYITTDLHVYVCDYIVRFYLQMYSMYIYRINDFWFWFWFMELPACAKYDSCSYLWKTSSFFNYLHPVLIISRLDVKACFGHVDSITGNMKLCAWLLDRASYFLTLEHAFFSHQCTAVLQHPCNVGSARTYIPHLVYFNGMYLMGDNWGACWQEATQLIWWMIVQ